MHESCHTKKRPGPKLARYFIVTILSAQEKAENRERERKKEKTRQQKLRRKRRGSEEEGRRVSE